MRVLIDTNIIIPRETDWPVPSGVSAVLRLLADRGDTVLVHPASIAELSKHRDQRRRTVTLSKVESYARLESPPNPDTDPGFRSVIGPPPDANSDVDDRLLYSVVRNAVDLLLTEDQGIHRKAFDVGIDDRVFTVAEALRFLKALRPKDESRVAPASVKLEPLYSVDLRDSFFDSMRVDYPEFDSWYQAKSREGRKAWIHRTGSGQVGAFMLLKEESESIALVGSSLAPERRVKICTIKVSRIGHRLGELLLKIAFEYALNNHISTLYLTAFTADKELLISLIKQFGFNAVGVNSRGERVFVKHTRPPAGQHTKEEVAALYYPCYYDGSDVHKFVVPVRPAYHERLFTGWTGDQLKLDFGQEMLPEGNAITKAYLCKSRIKKLDTGDILLFYRSGDASAITTVGVVQRVESGALTTDGVLTLAGKRIVYEQDEIEQMVKQHALLILFRWHADLEKPVNLRRLREMQVLRSAPQSVTQIAHEAYLSFKEETSLEDCLTVS